MARALSSRRPATPEDLLKFVLVGDPQVSPDGKRVVFVRKHTGDKNNTLSDLWAVESDGGRPRSFTSGGKDSFPRWSPDGERIAFLSGRDEDQTQIWTIAADGGEASVLTSFPEGDIGSFRWSPDGSKLAVLYRQRDPEWTAAAKKSREEKGLSDPPRILKEWYWREDGDGAFGGDRYKLFVVDAETGTHRLLYDKDRLGWLSFDWSPNSKEIAVLTNTHRRALVHPTASTLVRIQVTNRKVRPVKGVPPGIKDGVAWSPDGTRLAFAGTPGTRDAWGAENIELMTVDLKSGTLKRLTKKTDTCLQAHAISDVAEVSFNASFQWTPDSRRLLCTAGWHGESHLLSVDARRGGVTSLTKGPAIFSMGNLSADGRSIALTKSTSTSPPEIYRGRLANLLCETKHLTTFNKALMRQLDLSRPKSTWVTSADGWKVQCWVLSPPPSAKGRRRKKPAILQVHGGPHAQYGVGYFHEMQVLAGAGYTVFYSNPRGSKGYGRDHTAAIVGAWGDKDWQDVQAVIDMMSSHPEVDSSRMGVMGGSYGGYMTNWAIGHTNVFAGAITDRCVSNLVSLLGSGDIAEPPDDYWPGNTWDRTSGLWEQSPLRYMGKCKTPTLIIHSEGDLRCNIEQGDQVFTALQQRGVPVQFVRYPPSTSHGMSRAGPPDLRIHRLHQILGWWKRWL